MSRGKFRKTARKIVAPPGNIAPCRPGKRSATGRYGCLLILDQQCFQQIQVMQQFLQGFVTYLTRRAQVV